jgi:hypothetical protein
MELDTVQRHRDAFYRLVGTTADDAALTDQGEATDEVVDLYLTRGSREGQRWMLDMGYDGWRKRSAALTSASLTGADATDGGRYWTLPTDFLKLWGRERESAIRKANGDHWGAEITPHEDHWKGNYYYVRGDDLWVARNAVLPTTFYVHYHYLHPKWEALGDGSIDFPMEARWLIVAEAAVIAKEESWLPGGAEMELKIERALARARNTARHIARRTKQPRAFRKPPRFANHW